MAGSGVRLEIKKPGKSAISCIKDLVDRGRDPGDARLDMSKGQMSAASSLTLADMVRAGVRAGSEGIDMDHLDSDLSFILVDKAKLKSEILHRIQNLKAQGGIKMYAEVYRWFTETSGLGLMEEAAKLMNPKQASKEADVADAIEESEQKVRRLARHGEQYQLNETFKKIALKKILVGKILEHYELPNLEKLPFWELLVLVKEQAQIKKLEKDYRRTLGTDEGNTLGRRLTRTIYGEAAVTAYDELFDASNNSS